MTATTDDIYALLQRIFDDLPQIIERAKITGNQVQVTSLSQLSATLGLVRAGEFRSGNGLEPGSGFSGLRIAYPPMSYNNLLWNLVGLNGDVFQVGISAVDGTLFAGAGNIRLTAGGIFVYNGAVNTGAIKSNGNFQFGSDLSAPGTTSICIFSQAQTYNGESFNGGDILIGDNSPTKTNLKWDRVSGALKFRTGTVTRNSISGGGVLSGVMVQIRKTGLQTVSSGVDTAVTFDSVDFDDAGFANLGSFNTRLTVPVGYGGRYLCGYTAMWNDNVGTAQKAAVIRLNGSYLPVTLLMDSRPASASTSIAQPVCGVVVLNDGDYIECVVRQDSGGNETIGTGTEFPCMMWLLHQRGTSQVVN